MKKIKYIILLILIVPFIIKASDIKLTINCPQSASLGDTISCEINYSGHDINGISAKFVFENGIKYKSFTPTTNNYTLSTSSEKGFNLGVSSSFPQTYTLGELQITMPNSTQDKLLSVGIQDIDASDIHYNSISCNSATTTIKVKESNTRLSSLDIIGAIIDFDPDIKTYNITTKEELITISATPESIYANVTGTGVKKVNYGNNVYEVEVTSEEGKKDSYVIKVNRPDDRSEITALSRLRISEVPFTFNPDIKVYNIDVPSDMERIYITAYPMHEKANVSGVGTKILEYGANSFSIIVTAEKGNTETYTLNVSRDDGRSSINTLSSLEIEGSTLRFKPGIYEYNVAVKTDVTTIVIKGSATDKKAQVIGLGEKKLTDGINEFIVKVIAENGSENEYKINLIKQDDIPQTPVDDTKAEVKEIEIDGHLIKIYTLSKDSKIEKELGDKKRVIISNDGKIYEISFIKESDNTIVIILAVLVVLLTATIGIILSRKDKKDETNLTNGQVNETT